MNNYFTLEWNTTKDTQEPFGDLSPVCTYIGDAESIYHLWYQLTKIAGYKFIVARNSVGQEVDFTKSLRHLQSCSVIPSGLSKLQAEKLQRNRKVEYQWSSLASYIKLEEM